MKREFKEIDDLCYFNSKKVIDSAKKYLLKYDRVYKNYKACSLFNESCDIYEDIDKVNKIYRKVKR